MKLYLSWFIFTFLCISLCIQYRSTNKSKTSKILNEIFIFLKQNESIRLLFFVACIFLVLDSDFRKKFFELIDASNTLNVISIVLGLLSGIFCYFLISRIPNAYNGYSSSNLNFQLNFAKNEWPAMAALAMMFILAATLPLLGSMDTHTLNWLKGLKISNVLEMQFQNQAQTSQTSLLSDVINTRQEQKFWGFDQEREIKRLQSNQRAFEVIYKTKGKDLITEKQLNLGAFIRFQKEIYGPAMSCFKNALNGGLPDQAFESKLHEIIEAWQLALKSSEDPLQENTRKNKLHAVTQKITDITNGLKSYSVECNRERSNANYDVTRDSPEERLLWMGKDLGNRTYLQAYTMDTLRFALPTKWVFSRWLTGSLIREVDYDVKLMKTLEFRLALVDMLSYVNEHITAIQILRNSQTDFQSEINWNAVLGYLYLSDEISQKTAIDLLHNEKKIRTDLYQNANSLVKEKEIKCPIEESQIINVECYDIDRYERSIKSINNLLAYSIATSRCCLDQLYEAKEFAQDSLTKFAKNDTSQNIKSEEYRQRIDTYAYVLMALGKDEDNPNRVKYLSCSKAAFMKLNDAVRSQFEEFLSEPDEPSDTFLGEYIGFKNEYKIYLGHYYIAKFDTDDIQDDCSEREVNQLFKGNIDGK